MEYNDLDCIGFIVSEDDLVYIKNNLDITTVTNLKEDDIDG